MNVAGGTHYDAAAQKDLDDAFARMHDTFVAKGVAGVTTALWDPGAWAHLDRATLTWTGPALFAWIRSSWTTRSGTASFDKVYVRRSSPATAQSLTLNRNGTSSPAAPPSPTG